MGKWRRMKIVARFKNGTERVEEFAKIPTRSGAGTESISRPYIADRRARICRTGD